MHSSSDQSALNRGYVDSKGKSNKIANHKYVLRSEADDVVQCLGLYTLLSLFSCRRGLATLQLFDHGAHKASSIIHVVFT